MNKITYSAAEIAEILGVSKSAAYDLLHREDFPTLRIGKRLMVVASQFDEWLAAQSTTMMS